MSKSPNLQVRLDPLAHQHLCEIVEALHVSGRNISMANYVSTLILTQPVPNGHKAEPDPCADQEERQQ